MSVMDGAFVAMGFPKASEYTQWAGPGRSLVIEVEDYLDPLKAGNSEGDQLFMGPAWPLGGVVFFVVSKAVLAWICSDKVLNTTGQSALFRALVILHNLVLFGFSAWCAAWTFPLLIRTHIERGYWASFGDLDEELWLSGLGMASYWFYLSKFYEFFDSYILIVKRRPVSWLQSYHHAGAVLSVWTGLITHSPQAIWFTGMNSAVHTIMYLYYALTAARLGHLVQWFKPWITRIQLTQFLFGLYFGCWPLFLQQIGQEQLVAYTHPPLPAGKTVGSFHTPAQKWCTLWAYAYLIGLVVLFTNFYRKTYVVPRDTDKKAV